MKLSKFINLTGRQITEYVQSINFDAKRNYKLIDSKIYKNETDILSGADIFELEIDDCGWEVIPWYAGGFTNNGSNSYLRYVEHQSIILKKVPKYGEVLFFYICNYYGKVQLYCSSFNDQSYPIILLDGEFKHFNGLPLKYRSILDDKYTYDLSTLNKKYFNDPNLPYLLFPEKPNIYNLSTSKFCIAEYAQKVENFAKAIYENKEYFNNSENTQIKKLDFYQSYYSGIIDKETMVKCFISLKYCYPDITADDFNNVNKALKSKSPAMEKFLKKCKVDKGSYKADEIFSNSYHEKSHAFIYPEYYVVNFSNYTRIFDRLAEFRKIINEIECAKIDYISLYREANDNMIHGYVSISKIRDDKINKIAERISNEIISITENYNISLKALTEKVTKQYSDRLDMKKVKSYDETSLDNSISLLAKYLKNTKVIQSNNKVSAKNTNEISEEFKKHLKLFFDKLPERDYIVFSRVSKAWDAPYNVWVNDECIYEKQYDELAEAIGEFDANEWFDKYIQFISKELKELDKSDGDDLYPGNSKILVITNNYIIEENECSD